MQRKPSKKTRGINAAEKKFMSWVKDQPCIQCGNEPVIVDHCYGSTFKNNRILIGMWALLPLCERCDIVKTNGSHKAYLNRFGETQSESFTRLMTKTPDELKPPQDVIDAVEDWNK